MNADFLRFYSNIMVNVLKIQTLYFIPFYLISVFTQLFLKIISGIVNSIDPDQTDLGLHCLHMPFCQKHWCTKF